MGEMKEEAGKAAVATAAVVMEEVATVGGIGNENDENRGDENGGENDDASEGESGGEIEDDNGDESSCEKRRTSCQV